MKIYPILINFKNNAVPFFYVLADNEDQILERLDEKYVYGSWSSNDEDYEHDGYEDYYAYMLAIRGEINDEQVMNGALEGSQQYGWDEGQEITEEEAQIMLKFGVAKDWREKLA
jgi:hypothetical protein